MKIEPRKIIAADGKEMTVRTMEIQDSEKVLETLRQTNTEFHYFLREADEVPPSTPEEIEKEAEWIQKMLDSPTDLELVLEDEGRIVGSMGFCAVKKYRKLRHRCSFGIGLISEYTDRKLGRQIIEIILEEAKKAGFTQMELGVFADNPRAKHLYEKLGFVEYGKIPQAFKLDDGTLIDEILMYRPL